MKQKVAVGLSGGVDSAVSAAVLKEQGYEVIGVFMKNWSDDFGLNGECPWEQDQSDAKAVADHLGIEFLTYNFEIQYREKVMEYFFDEYRKGRTPNPDILCNSEIKFNVFLKKCLAELSVDFIATGHYARVVSSDRLQDSGLESLNLEHGAKTFHLLKGLDNNKDQSYFLCRLTQYELSRTLFPIGHLQKSEVRRIAESLNLPVAKKKDSQGICFVGKINVRKFLRDELGLKEGLIIDIDTQKVLGEHQGLWFYTNGQREGIGLAGGPWFVVDKDLQNNILLVAKGTNNPALFKIRVVLKDINIISSRLQKEICSSFSAEASLRYRQKPSKALLSYCPAKEKANEIAELTFLSPQRAVTPGQFGCVYLGDELVLSGIIS